MAKYLKLASGSIAEQAATASSAGAGDAGKIVELDGNGRLDLTFMPVGVGTEARTITASETLAAGDLVNIHNSTGNKVRKADASNGRRAHGFVLAAVTSGQPGTVYLEGSITGLSSLTPGAPYFLSGASAGLATATPPATSGHIVQQVGYAVSDTEISFEPSAPITLA